MKTETMAILIIIVGFLTGAKQKTVGILIIFAGFALLLGRLTVRYLFNYHF